MPGHIIIDNVTHHFSMVDLFVQNLIVQSVLLQFIWDLTSKATDDPHIPGRKCVQLWSLPSDA
jgi:hypothetical protein